MHEGPDSVYLSDKPIDTIVPDGPQGTQVTEQKSSDWHKLFDGSDGGGWTGATVFTGRSGSLAPGAPLASRAVRP
jgi:hypothetical protein